MIGLGRAGKLLMDYLLFNAAGAGLQQVLLLLHPEDNVTQPYYEALLRRGKAWGLSIRFARQHIAPDRTKPTGTADAVEQALTQYPSWQRGRLLVCNSDNLYSAAALRQLWECPCAHGLISYDRAALDFPPGRINAFALVKTDARGFVRCILEKPDDAAVQVEYRQSGRVGVSMNAFSKTCGR